jgi:uncharacterized protein YmfQ (DUF2313 family)
VGHLPKGFVWPKWFGDARTPVWNGLLTALGTEPARVDQKVRKLLLEMDPRTASDTFEDWLQAYGLPDTCVGPAPTQEIERTRLVQLVTLKGSTTRRFLTAIAFDLGFDIFVQTYRPARMGEVRCSDLWHGSFAGLSFAWAMQIHSPNVAVRRMFMGSAQSGDSLCSFGNSILECVIRKHVRATTLPQLTFAYNDPQNTFGAASLWEQPGPADNVDTALPARPAGATYFMVGTFAAEAFGGSDAAYALIASATRVSVGAAAGGDEPRATVNIAPAGQALISIVQTDAGGERTIAVRVNGAPVGTVSVAGTGAIAGDMIAFTATGLDHFGLKLWPLGPHEVDWLERVLARQFNIPLAAWPVDLSQGGI